MTHTVPCAISCRSDKNEKTSLLEMRTAIREGLVLQNRCEVMTKPFFCCPLKILCVFFFFFFFFFFFNMWNESEHSANKFPYPGVLEDARTTSVASSLRKPNEGVHNFLRSRHQANSRSVSSVNWAWCCFRQCQEVDLHMDQCNLHLLFLLLLLFFNVI